MKQCQDVLRRNIGLGQHRSTGLCQNPVLREVNHLFGHFGVADGGFGGLQVFCSNVNSFNCQFEPVLVPTEVGTLLVDFLQVFVNSTD